MSVQPYEAQTLRLRDPALQMSRMGAAGLEPESLALVMETEAASSHDDWVGVFDWYCGARSY